MHRKKCVSKLKKEKTEKKKREKEKMNFVDCFNILQNRKAETENKCCDIAHISTIDTENSHNNNNNPTNNNEININQFIDIKTIQLINIFQKLQEERVKVSYKCTYFFILFVCLLI